MTSRITDSLFERIASPVDDDVVAFYDKLLAEKGDMSAREFRHAVRTEIYRSWPAEDESQGGPGTGDGNRYARQIAYMFQVLNVGVGIVPNVVVPAGEPGRQSTFIDGADTSEVEFDEEVVVQEREASLYVPERKRSYGLALARFEKAVGKVKTVEDSENQHKNIHKVIEESLKEAIISRREDGKSISPGERKPPSSSYKGFLPPIENVKRGGGDSSDPIKPLDSMEKSDRCPEDGHIKGEGTFGVVLGRGVVEHNGKQSCIVNKFFKMDSDDEYNTIRSLWLEEKVINRIISKILDDHTLIVADQSLASLKPSENQIGFVTRYNELFSTRQRDFHDSFNNFREQAHNTTSASDAGTMILKDLYINYLSFPDLETVREFISSEYDFQPLDITTFILTLKEVVIKCYDKGFVHTDIKPDNVMFDKETRKFYVIDFDSQHVTPCYGIIIPECHDINFSGTERVYPNYVLNALQQLYSSKYNLQRGVKKNNHGRKGFEESEWPLILGDYSHCIMAILLTACEMVPIDNPDRKAIQMRLWYDNVEAAEGGGLQWKTDHGVLEYYGPNRHPNYRRLGTSAPRIPLTPEEAQARANERLKEWKERQEKRGGNAPRPPSDTIWSALLGIGVCLLVTAASSIAGSFA